MREHCHRCGTDLTLSQNEEAARYCYHCGLAQLRISAYGTTTPVNETDGSEAGATSDAEAAESKSASGVHWRRAIRCAAAVAVTGALLNLLSVKLTVLSALGMMWLLLGSITTIALYHRGYRAGRMDGRVGLRIGATVGLLQSLLLVGVLAASGFVLRYHLHGMGNFDAQMTQSVEDVIARMTASPSTASQMTPEMIALYRSPEVRAASMMTMAAVLAVGLTLFSTATGIMGGFLFAQRRRVDVG